VLKLRIIFICSLLLFAFCPVDETWVNVRKEEVLNDFSGVRNWFASNESYQLKLKYQSFESFSSMKSADESIGYFKRSKLNYHSVMMGIETIQNEKIRIMVDSSNKTILLAEPKKELQSPFDEQEYIKVLDKCRALKKMEGPTEKKLRIEFPAKFYMDSYTITIEKKEIIKKLVIYFGQEISANENEKNAKKSKPRVEISFSEHKANAVIPPHEFSTKKYIEFDGKNYKTNKLYSEYKIYDTRVKTK
jgi:hypothetical protein